MFVSFLVFSCFEERGYERSHKCQIVVFISLRKKPRTEIAEP